MLIPDTTDPPDGVGVFRPERAASPAPCGCFGRVGSGGCRVWQPSFIRRKLFRTSVVLRSKDVDHMLARTPFVQFIPPRIDAMRRRLVERLWEPIAAEIEVSQSPITSRITRFDEIDPRAFKRVERVPMHWGKYYDHCWWKLIFPALGAEGDLFLRWKDQGEATLYVGGMPNAGIDPGHLYVPMPKELRGGGEAFIESICCRTGVWVTGETQGIDAEGSRFEGVSIHWRNRAAWDAFIEVDLLLELAILEHKRTVPDSDWPSGYGFRKPAELLSPLCRRLLHALDLACDSLDREGPSGVAASLAQLRRSLPADASAFDATLCGHAHIDLVWLWPETIGEFKATHSFANVLSLQERFPELCFTYSQPASYEAVARRSPSLLERVREQIAAGRWEATGAMYVESDTQLPCGEALVRSIELGQELFKTLRADGSASRIVWLPDCFGFSGVLPTLMQGFGIPYFFTTKQHWSSATTFPLSSFQWRGHDGSSVVAHVAWEHYNLTAHPSELDRAQRNHRQGALHPEVLVATGYGDGGGGPNELMAERARRLANLSGMPRTRWGSAEGFFDRLAQHASELPVWSGEIYLETHRGVQTTNARMKTAFRNAECALRDVEAAACATGRSLTGEADWKRLVFCQFHDHVTGTSVREVYDRAIPELDSLAGEAARQASALLSEPNGQPCLFNATPATLRVVVGETQLQMPPYSGVPASAGQKAATPVVEGRLLANEHTKLVIARDGTIESLHVEGRPLALATGAAQLFLFPDHPAVFEAWDVDRQTLSCGSAIHTEDTETVSTARPGIATLTFSRTFGQGSTLTQTYTLAAGSRVVLIDLDIEWKEERSLLKFVIPTHYRGQYARFGAPFGSTLRPQLSSTLAQDAMYEVPGSRWACVADDGERDGVMLLAESKYGFGARDGLLHLSLLRAPLFTNWGSQPNAYADRGLHHIRLALGRFDAEESLEGQPALLADTLFSRPIAYTGRPIGSRVPLVEGGSSLVPAWLRPLSPTQSIWRLHETLGRRGRVKLRAPEGTTIRLVNLKNEVERSLDADVLEFSPYQVISLLLQHTPAAARSGRN